MNILLFLCFLCFYVSNLSLIRTFHIHSYSRHYIKRFSKENDFIDAEIVGEENYSLGKTGSNENIDLDDGKNMLMNNSVVQGILKVFGKDELSIKKRKRNEDMNSFIDKAFEGSGLLGGGLKLIVKGVAGLVSDAFADSIDDVDAVREATIKRLESDESVVDMFGSDISLGSTISSMSSSININGSQKKTIQLIFQVSGRLNEGVARVSADIDGSRNVEIKNLEIETQNEGGRRSSTIRSSQIGRGRVIDTDEIL